MVDMAKSKAEMREMIKKLALFDLGTLILISRLQSLVYSSFLALLEEDCIQDIYIYCITSVVEYSSNLRLYPLLEDSIQD